ncbi:BAG family molecular chaperone regulator 7-like isoform X2 [Panicum virgatum]|uniref:BAG family molecular chaperone regulator 7-like isoform X2 n=1 Tax=Panicum virgatum TaxID=38727 RepID=UPI0019D67988|nr:BAG family molecular chaperone regulator 7-like isoform X2 [Panicum virgatum]
MGSHRHTPRFLDDPFFPFPPPPQTSSCPFLDFDSLDLFLPPSDPSPYPFLLRDLTDRVAALELAVAARRPEPTTRKCTYVTEAGGRKVKWTSIERPRAGDRTLRWEAEVKSPDDDGFDRKWKWEAKGASSAAPRKLKWGAAVKGKGSLEPWSQVYTREEDFTASDTDDDEEEEKKADNNKTKVADKKKKHKKNNEDKAVSKEKKCPVATVKIEEISDDNDAGCVAIRKVLRCLRDLAVAKAKLKEMRSLFYNISYRRRMANDHKERQRFSEKIIVLLITVDALEGPDYMVRVAKKSMLEELEAMLEVVDPQPPGKQRSLSRRKFDLPEGGAVSDEKVAGVNKAVRIIQEGK